LYFVKTSVRGVTAESLLQGIPTSRVLEGDIGACNGERMGGEEVVEANDLTTSPFLSKERLRSRKAEI